MATRTIANAGGNWNTAATWVEGAVPTSNDDVVATATSGAVTLNTAANCRSLDFTNYVNTITMSGSVTLSIGNATGGALTIVAGMGFSVSTASFTFAFVSTGDNSGAGWPITTAGKTMPSFNFNGVGGKWVLQDSVTTVVGATFRFTAGTLDTNSKSITAGIFNITGTLAKTLTLGSSILTATSGGGNWGSNSLSGSLTVTANTATLNFTGQTVFGSDPIDWNGLSVTCTSTGNFSFTGLVTTSSSPITFKNFTFNYTGATANFAAFGTPVNLVITGTLTINGAAAPKRVLVGPAVSSVTSVIQYIINAAAVSFSYVDFFGVVAQGAASWNLSGITGGAGDAGGGNSGITFTAPTTYYGVAAGNWSSTSTWASTSGGTPGAGTPLPHDAVILDGNSGAGTYTVDYVAIAGSIDTTNFTGTLAFSATLSAYIRGGITLGAGMTIAQSQAIFFTGGGTIKSNGKAFPKGIGIYASGATVDLFDDLAISAVSGVTSLTIGMGTFNSNSKNITTVGFSISGTVRDRSALFGTSTITLTGISSANFSYSSTTGSGSIDLSAATIVIGSVPTASSITIPAGAVLASYIATATISVAQTLTLTGSPAANSITINEIHVGPNRTLRISNGTVIVGVWDVNGISGTPVLVQALTSASVIAKIQGSDNTPRISQYATIKDIQTLSATFFAYPGGVNNGNNTWVFGPSMSSAQPDGVSGMSGGITVIPAGGGGVARAIAGQTDGVSGISGALGVFRSVTGRADSVSGISAILGVVRAIAATSSGVSGVSASTLAVLRVLAALCTGQSSVSGDIIIPPNFRGTVGGVSGISGSFNRQAGLSGTVKPARGLIAMVDD